MVGPAAWEWWQGARPTDPLRSVALRVADDMTYGAGLWHQVITRRRARALIPVISEWPGGRPAVEGDTVAR